VTTLVIGLAPVIRAARWNIASAIASGGTNVRRHSRIRMALAIGQIGVSLALLVGAGLFVRSLRNVHALPLGYDAPQLLVVNALAGAELFAGVDPSLSATLAKRASTIEGVVGTARSVTVPFTKLMTRRFRVANSTVEPTGDQFLVDAVSPEYFRVAGTRILSGRGFTAADSTGTPSVVIVSASMAARLWPGRRAIGECLTFITSPTECVRVVGIAQPTRESSFDHDEMLVYFIPLAQERPSMPAALLLRVDGDARRSADRIRHVLEADLPQGVRLSVTPLQDVLDRAAQSWRIGATLLSFLASLALVLAAAGIYGATACEVTEREHDLGIRAALGASRRHLVRWSLRDATLVATGGVALGAMLAALTTPLLRPLLFHVSARDPRTFAAACAATATAFALSAAIPALRAARVDPVSILRSG
jgi:predicted permease